MKVAKLAIGMFILSFIIGMMMGFKQGTITSDAKHAQDVVTIIILNPELHASKMKIKSTLMGKYQLNMYDADWFAEVISIAAYRYEVPDDIMVAMIATESSFKLDAVSKSKAIGPAQIMPASWKGIVYNIHDPAENIIAGAHILREYKNKCGSWDCALRAYNIGIGNFNKGKLRSESTTYINTVNKHIRLVSNGSVAKM
jgi:soluble lytic murein transglycosylase-like protein